MTRMGERFTLVYLLRNTITNLTTLDEQVACFRNAAAHLQPGGYFVIENYIPALQRLPPGETARVVTSTPTHLGVEEYDLASQIAVSRHHWIIDGEPLDALVSAPLRLAVRARPHGAARRDGSTRALERLAARAVHGREPGAHLRVAARHGGECQPMIPATTGPRRVTGMAAILLPYRGDGTIDWPSFEAHVARTAAAGLVAAVNMDTGYVQLLGEDDRRRTLEIAADVCPGDFVAGAYVDDEPGASFDLDGYRRARRTSATGRHPRPLPVARPERARRRGLGRCDQPGREGGGSLHRFRAGSDVRPVRPHRGHRRLPRAARDPLVCRRQALVAQSPGRVGTPRSP